MAYRNYKDLTVWQKAMDLIEEVYRLVKILPKEETYALSDQIRRSVVSVPSNIAEGQGRESKNEFRSFLSIAKGSLSELETQLLICVRLKYFSESDIETSLSLSNEIDKMLTTLILKLKALQNI